MLNHIKKLRLVAVISLLTIGLYGCMASKTLIEKRELNVQTKMSDTVFLDPLPPAKQIAFVQITNTSGKPDFDIRNQVVRAVEDRGYKVTRDPEEAYVWLQANILSVGSTDLREARDALEQGYGGAISGLATGAALGSFSNNSETTLAAGLVGGLVGMAADAMVKDVNISTIVDVRVSERSSVPVKESTKSALKQGNSSLTRQASKKDSHWQKYQTRILATANKVNLEFDEASPRLIAGVTRSISGMLG